MFKWSLKRISGLQLHGLMKDIKGYHIHLLSSSNSSIEKGYDGFSVYPWWTTQFTDPENKSSADGTRAHKAAIDDWSEISKITTPD